jgi:hypothetical protein
MFQGVHHVGYMTDDVTAARKLFVEQFDGKVIGESTNPEGNKAVFVRMGTFEVEIIEPADKSRLGGKTGLIIDHVGLFVGDFDGAKAGLAGKGVKFAATGPMVSVTKDTIHYLETESTLGTKIHLTKARG